LSHTELYDFLFLPGFSTAGAVSVHSGRGVGLDVVRAELVRLGGRISIESEVDAFTRFELALPVTRVVVSALLMRVAGEAFALPLARAGRVVRVAGADVHSAEGRDYVVIDGENVGVVRADELLEVGQAEPPPDGDLTLVLLGDRRAKYALIVDEALGEDDLVVRPLDPRLGRVPDVAATAILADGAPTLLLDADDLLRSIEKLTRVRKPVRARSGDGSANLSAKRLLVVDDSPVVREAERQMLAARGYIVDVAADGVEAWDTMRNRRYDLAVIDVDMPRMDGIELVRRIRRDTELASLPVVIVSYKDRDEDRLKATAVGVDRYLAKGSFHEDELVRAVDELLGGRS
jgi:two-component system sensor histidine kinase and response regulator WspE